MQIPSKTIEDQKRAAHPQNSAWVSANAGSGKTFVLARRVIRLLLAGTDASRILCLTFTKAAAAEMATRVFDILAEWTHMSDEELAAELETIEGRLPDANTLARARRLFAKALETPGGLKIQTIHAFCESLLHQFPLEANVAGHFSVLDDRLVADLLAHARAAVLQHAQMEPDSELGKSLALLIDLLPDSGVERALSELIGKRDAFRQWAACAGSLDAALKDLRTLFGIAEGENLAQLEAEFRRSCSLSSEEIKAFAEALKTGTKTDNDRASDLLNSLSITSDQAWQSAWLPIFLTKDLGPRKTLATKKIQTGFPHVVERLIAEQERLLALLERRASVLTLEGTQAILRLSDAVLNHYEGEKMQRGLLDFEDLVVRCAQLLSNSEAAQWVQYKLDQGLDHILVDEAQDTSPRQWQVIGALAEEFFTGESARGAARTIFAVGDEKQSIYSFQGAVPAYFAQMRRHFAKHVTEAQKPFESVELTLSFRSTPDVLGAVDKVFENAEAYQGLSQENVAPVHEAIRHNDPGRVEIWPLEEQQETLEPEDWTQPVDRIGQSNPMIRLASRIANQIKEWDDKQIANPGDVLVLVRKRGPFVEALNRELKQLDIPSAGSDRLVLTDHIAVKDLVALSRFILLPEDDLSLAAVLKSPLFGLDDDALFEIAQDPPGKPRAGTLWQSLVKKADLSPLWADVKAKLETWRDRADFVPPFEFFARILGADGFRLEFRKRMGTEVDDVLDEFLSLTLQYELTGTPGLEGFIAWLQAAPTEIKRELNASKGMVRIMTVHGSKGLEAPYVILVDSCNAPVTSHHDPIMLPLEQGGDDDKPKPPAFVWLPTKEFRTSHHTQALDAIKEGQQEEYRRLLYVALTRAKDRLIVCGWSPKRGPNKDCWYQLVADGLQEEAREVKNAADEITSWVWTKGGVEKGEPVLPYKKTGDTSAVPKAPSWAARNVDPFARMKRLKPSEAFEEMEAKDGIEQPSAFSALDAARKTESWPLLRGQLTHRLLEFLPDMPEEEWEGAINRYLDAALPKRFAEHREKLTSEVDTILNSQALRKIFSAEGRAEVPIQGELYDDKGRPAQVFGVIDRLLVTESEVTIVDYKTNSWVPNRPEDVSETYVAQVATYRKLLAELYPKHTIRAFLLFTAGPKLLEISAQQMDRFQF
ncbi:double-strand break repair helicase AddA [Rhodobacteraceae bacterium RKSG542]|uniref:double-strand break repair helicase AddA n=1 Tax=Pseudovibrio flavus TaxID=2529854 RepID=UPI0012BD76FF|nr:double-strand break repair helicase AddA [Pseudovibrio flavus]MTI17801.1 double-strand break repair helicase AddA [Pseudovibrio flavus]